MRLPLSRAVTLFVLGIAAGSAACTIPVFRYALDRWEADPYRLVVPAAVARQPEIARLLLPYRGNGVANLKIEESADPALKEASLLDSRGGSRPLWTGPLTAQALGTLVDSPARRELLKHILAGDSVVWVVVDRGTPEGGAERERVVKRLRYLEQVAALPPQDPNDPDSQLGPGPALKLKFATLQVSMDDPAEKAFCAMLAGSKCADALAKGQAFAAPVFGRGRVLGSFPLADLDDTSLEDITMFLTGRCSCRVKNQSPGWDIVLRVDWDAALRQADAKPAANAAAGRKQAEPEAVRIEPRKP